MKKDDLKSKIKSTRKTLTAKFSSVPDNGGPPAENSLIDESQIYKSATSQQDGDAWLYYQTYKNCLCFDHTAGEWFKWSGHYWELDKINEAIRKLDKIIDIYGVEAQRCAWLETQAAKKQDGDKKKEAELKRNLYLKKISTLQKKRWKLDVLELSASGEKSLGITGEEWDLDPWLLGCPNGVIELKTGNFRAGRQSDYIKTVCPTEWRGINEPCPNFERFLNEIFDNNHSLSPFFQRLSGYSITGLATEHILPIAWGQGRNGKGTLFDVFHHVLGPLAGPIQAEMLLDQGRLRSSAGPASDVMALRGRRLVWGSETNEGRKFNMGKVKWLVGGDILCGREPYGRREVNFKPTHTLFLLTNNKPKADPNDYALWQRIHLIPFALSFIDDPQKTNEKKCDHRLSEKLKAEASGILAWLVRGCLDWQKQGLNPPDIVKNATAQYKQDEDDIGKFIQECCVLSPDAKVKAGTLRDEYDNWCKSFGIKSVNGKRFSQYIRNHFDATPKTRTGTYYLGIGLAEEIKP